MCMFYQKSRSDSSGVNQSHNQLKIRRNVFLLSSLIQLVNQMLFDFKCEIDFSNIEPKIQRHACTEHSLMLSSCNIIAQPYTRRPRCNKHGRRSAEPLTYEDINDRRGWNAARVKSSHQKLGQSCSLFLVIVGSNFCDGDARLPSKDI